jgi:hypothetical protein
MKYWEIIADNLSKAGWSWGCVAAVDFDGRMLAPPEAQREQSSSTRHVMHYLCKRYLPRVSSAAGGDELKFCMGKGR